jgi:hypothetical protein
MIMVADLGFNRGDSLKTKLRKAIYYQLNSQILRIVDINTFSRCGFLFKLNLYSLSSARCLMT